MPLVLIAVAAVVLGCAGARAGRGEDAGPDSVLHARPDAEWWVDASAGTGGDGSSSRPWSSLAHALERARGRTWVHLAAGDYQGPFEIAPSVRLIGEHGTVLRGDGVTAVVRTSGPAHLDTLIVEGGEIGVEARADLSLSGVRFSRQRQAAIHQRRGALRAVGLEVVGSVKEAVGIGIDSGASARIVDSTFRGALRIGMEIADEAQVEVRSSVFEGPVTAMRSRGGAVRVESSSASGGSGPAFAFSRGTASIREVRVVGHEYGILAGDGCTLDVIGFTSVRAQRAGIALASAKGRIRDIAVLESGGYGGVQSVNGDLQLQDFWIDRARSYGIQLHQGVADVRDGVVTGVSDPDSGATGDGVHIRLGRASIASVAVLRTSGAGVLAAQGARVALRDLLLDDNHWGGLVAETGAHVEASSLLVRRSSAAAVAVPGRAVVKVDLLRTANNAQGAVWAECVAGAEVLLSRVRSSDGDAGTSRCVGPWKAPRLFDPLAEPPSASSRPDR